MLLKFSISRSRGKHGKERNFFTSNVRLRSRVACVRLCNCFIFNRTNMQPGWRVILRRRQPLRAPGSLASAFIPVGLFPVCTSRVCCSGAWNVAPDGCGQLLVVNLSHWRVCEDVCVKCWRVSHVKSVLLHKWNILWLFLEDEMKTQP